MANLPIKGFNLKALEALKNQRALENTMAGELSGQAGAPLTQNPFQKQLSNFEVSGKQLPEEATASANLGDTIPDSSKPQVLDPEAPTPPVKSIEGNLGDVIPQDAKTIPLVEPSVPAKNPSTYPAPKEDPNLDNTGSSDSEDLASKWDQYKKLALPAAGAAAAGTYLGLNSDNNAPSAASVGANVIPPPSPPMQHIDIKDPLVVTGTVPEDKGPSKIAAKSSNEDDSEDKDVPTPPESSGFNIASLQKLKELQDQARDNLKVNTMGRVAAAGAAAIGGQKNEMDAILADQAKQINDVPEQYQKLVDFQKQDPNSAASVTYRKMAQYLGVPFDSKSSAADLEKAFPQMVNIKTREDMIAARKEIAQQNNDERHYRNQMMQLALQDRQTAKEHDAEVKELNLADKRIDSWAKTMAIPSNRSTLGQAKAQIFAVDRVKALMEGHPAGDLNPQEMAEVIKGLDRVISGGASTEHGYKTLDPQTFRSKWAALMQQFTNKSQGAGGQEFAKRFAYNLENEKRTSQQQAYSDIRTLLAGSGSLANHKNPEIQMKFNDFLQKAGLPLDLFDKTDTRQAPNANPKAPGQSKAPPPPSGQLVSMVAPDGRKLMVPQDKVEEMKSHGAELQR